MEFCTIVSVSTPIDDAKNDDFDMYPNPNEGIVNVKFYGVEYQSLNIFTFTGNLVYSKTIDKESELKINLTHVLKSRVYLVSLKSNSKIATKKLIVR